MRQPGPILGLPQPDRPVVLAPFELALGRPVIRLDLPERRRLARVAPGQRAARRGIGQPLHLRRLVVRQSAASQDFILRPCQMLVQNPRPRRIVRRRPQVLAGPADQFVRVLDPGRLIQPSQAVQRIGPGRPDFGRLPTLPVGRVQHAAKYPAGRPAHEERVPHPPPQVVKHRRVAPDRVVDRVAPQFLNRLFRALAREPRGHPAGNRPKRSTRGFPPPAPEHARSLAPQEPPDPRHFAEQAGKRQDLDARRARACREPLERRQPLGPVLVRPLGQVLSQRLVKRAAALEHEARRRERRKLRGRTQPARRGPQRHLTGQLRRRLQPPFPHHLERAGRAFLDASGCPDSLHLGLAVAPFAQRPSGRPERIRPGRQFQPLGQEARAAERHVRRDLQRAAQSGLHLGPSPPQRRDDRAQHAALARGAPPRPAFQVQPQPFGHRYGRGRQRRIFRPDPVKPIIRRFLRLRGRRRGRLAIQRSVERRVKIDSSSRFWAASAQCNFQRLVKRPCHRFCLVVIASEP
ncbi:MAG TPA: hypothetical protein PLG73_02440 [Candidatus Sumerlaeota bacterium]|nr:hypothetical protein [Candidatus Sumerlaeota bacterium]